MHVEFSSLLTNVWENRQQILYGHETLGTIENRVYYMYAPQYRIRATQITEATYQAQITGILAPPFSGWYFQQYTWASNWRNRRAASDQVTYRVYVKPRLTHAAHVFQEILRISSPSQPSQAPPLPAQFVASQTSQAAYMARVRRGIFTDVITATKIALAEQAFSGRSDRIVVYINHAGGRDAARYLGEAIARFGNYFENDHPMMTDQVASGISIAPEVTQQQNTAAGGNFSFGSLRSTLIAWALLEVSTGRTINSGTHAAPINESYLRQRAPTRIDFVRTVQAKFRTYGINVNYPWL